MGLPPRADEAGSSFERRSTMGKRVWVAKVLGIDDDKNAVTRVIAKRFNPLSTEEELKFLEAGYYIFTDDLLQELVEHYNLHYGAQGVFQRTGPDNRKGWLTFDYVRPKK